MYDSNAPIINFKQGDDFKLEMTVIDPNSVTALANKVILNTAQVAHDVANAADPQIPADIASTLGVLVTAQAAYDLSIIVDITAWTITAAMAWCNKVVNTFTVVKTDETAGIFTIALLPAATSLWKARKYTADIQFVRPSGTVTSETFLIDVERSPTNG